METKRLVDCYCASLPRHNHVITTVQSILDNPECGTVTVLLSETYKDEDIDLISIALYDERVTLMITDDTKHSNEKLRFISDGTNPYIALIDDDIVYPKDYLSKMIDGCEQYQAHVSLHGAILYPRPIRSYYADRFVYRGLKTVEQDYQVDICSSCMTLFKREWHPDLDKWYDESPTVSMDDITISLKAKTRAIPMFVLAHKEGYVTHKEQLPDESYVFDQYTTKLGVSDKFQTDYINLLF